MKKFVRLLSLAMLAAGAMAQTNTSLPAGTALKVKLENTLATAATNP